MKTEGKIKHKLKQVRHRLLQKEIRKATSKKPCNCKHSGLVRGAASEPLFYVCLLDADKPDVWEGLICDNSVPNTCPFFKPSKSETQIKEEINAILESGDMGKIATHYPDVAALLWVLAGVEEETESEEINEIDTPSTPTEEPPTEQPPTEEPPIPTEPPTEQPLSEPSEDTGDH